MNKKDFFKNYRYAFGIFYLLWIVEWKYEDSMIVTTIKHIGVLPIMLSLFVLGIIIDYFLNKEESFIKTEANTFNVITFLLIMLIILAIRFRLF